MYISEGNKNVFANILRKLTIIQRYAYHKIHMELLADLLDLGYDFLQLVRLNTSDI